MSTVHSPPIFGESYIVEGTGQHKHTVIALHGFGSSGRTFADRILYGAEYSPNPVPLARQFFSPWLRNLPLDQFRFVFPTAPNRAVTFPAAKVVPAWFHVSSFTDLQLNQDEQIEGLHQSVKHLSSVVQNEITRLDDAGRSARDLLILGRSQGSSVTGWTLMSGGLPAEIGGVILAGSWLVHARALMHLLRAQDSSQISLPQSTLQSIVEEERMISKNSLEFAREMLSTRNPNHSTRTPILMGHSIDDEWISINLGRQFRDALGVAGYEPEWKEYVGAKEEGHWFEEKDEYDNIVRFLLRNLPP